MQQNTKRLVVIGSVVAVILFIITICIVAYRKATTPTLPAISTSTEDETTVPDLKNETLSTVKSDKKEIKAVNTDLDGSLGHDGNRDLQNKGTEEDYRNASKPKEERLKEEGVKTSINEDISSGWVDPVTKETLPINPTDDSKCKESWKEENGALSFMVLPSYAIECDNDFYFKISSHGKDREEFMAFMEKYLRRVCETATLKKLQDTDYSYGYTLRYIEPSSYPDEWTYNENFDLLCVRFHLNNFDN